MRSHKDIIRDADGATELGRKIGVEPNTVHAWVRADSIPAAYWRRIVSRRIATFDELAAAAEARRAAS